MSKTVWLNDEQIKELREILQNQSMSAGDEGNEHRVEIVEQILSKL